MYYFAKNDGPEPSLWFNITTFVFRMQKTNTLLRYGLYVVLAMAVIICGIALLWPDSKRPTPVADEPRDTLTQESCFLQAVLCADEGDYPQAIKWYKKSADMGCPEAMIALGEYNMTGRGTNVNDTLAVSWYQRAADTGNAVAQLRLGGCYFNGKGVNQDYRQAVHWFELAAEQGNADAQCMLGYCYLEGLGVTANHSRSRDWYERAAEQGDMIAREMLR